MTHTGPTVSPQVERLRLLIEALRRAPTSHALLSSHEATYGAVSERTFRRDINVLRYLGFTIEARPGEYHLLSEPVRLDVSQDEARLLATVRALFPVGHPYHTTVEAFLDRLRPLLDSPLAKLLDDPMPLQMALQTAIDYLPHRETLHTLQNALYRQLRVAFEYKALEGTDRYGPLDPHDLRFENGHFYLRAYVPARWDTLEFRIDRIVGESLRMLPDRAQPRPQRPVRFTYRLAPRIASRGISERFEKQQVKGIDAEGWTIIYAEGTSDFRIIQELLRYGGQAELLEPAPLRAKMAEVVASMARLYEDVGSKSE